VITNTNQRLTTGARFVWTLDRGPVTTGENTLPKRDEEILE
jgi:hypothetical protein